MQVVYAGAKVNLLLNVEGKEGGLHLIRGVYVTCGLADKVTLSAREDDRIAVRYVDREGYKNDSALLMAELLQKRYGTHGMDIIIEKHIPEMKGLGGSSADAAGVARAFLKEFSVKEVDKELLLRAGSDVPFQYEGGCALVSGRGEKTEKVTLPKMYLAILCPPCGVSTAECFALYDIIGGENGDIGEAVKKLTRGEMVFFNGLERAASSLAGEIKTAKNILEKAGFVCGMTGSGSAVFGAEYNENIFREKLKKVVLPTGYKLMATTTEVTV